MEVAEHLILWVVLVGFLYLWRRVSALGMEAREQSGCLDALQKRLQLLERERLPIATPVGLPDARSVPLAPSVGRVPPAGRVRAVRPAPSVPPAPAPPRPSAPAAQGAAPAAAAPSAEREPATPPQGGLGLESRIGGHWLNWLGVVTLVFALGLGLKLAVEAGYVTWIFHLPPLAYLAAGWLLGGGLLAAGERLRWRLPQYAQALAGAGVAALYWTTYAGHALYGVLSAASASAGLALTGVLAIGLSVRHRAQLIGWLGVVLAYASPMLLRVQSASPAPLFLYLSALNIAVLGVSVWLSWSRFRLAAFLASAGLYLGWHLAHYSERYLPDALLFTSLNSLLFLAVLAAHPLLWRQPTSDADLALAVLNPFLTGSVIYLLLTPHHAGWMGPAAALTAAAYWGVSRAMRLRDGTPDYLERLFFATALVFALLAVPLQFKGRAMTPAWSFTGAALCWVGYRSDSARTRRWGIAALALAVGRLLTWDAPLAPGPAAAPFFNQRGFAFAAVILAMAAAAGTWADAWRRERELPGARGGVLVAFAILMGILMDHWILLDVPREWGACGWSAVAAVALGFGWQLRCRQVRTAGGVLAAFAALFALDGLATLASRPERASGLAAAIILALGAAWGYHRAGELPREERASSVPAFAGGAALLAMSWAWVELGRGWLPASWCCVALLLLGAGAVTGRSPLRLLAIAGAAALTLEVLVRELPLREAHPLLLHTRSAALLAAVVAWSAIAGVMGRQGEPGERLTIAPATAGASLLGLLWVSCEMMDLAGRLAPAPWTAHAAQLGLSAAWLLYAAGALALGFRRSLPTVRWGGMALLLAAVVKVYLIDLAQLALGYRMVSFLGLAAILLGVSYAYQIRERRSG